MKGKMFDCQLYPTISIFRHPHTFSKNRPEGCVRQRIIDTEICLQNICQVTCRVINLL